MSSVLKDVRYALRVLANSPGFTATAVLTLALGIGCNTALFTVINALLLRPLPFAQPERLVLISSEKQSTGVIRGPLSWPRFQMIDAQNRSFAGVAAFTNEVFNRTGRGDPEQLGGARVSWNFFQVLGVQPVLGRSFTVAEDKPGGDLVVLLSDGFWRRHFAADPAAIGRQVTLDQKDYTVTGVLPPDFRFDLFGQQVDVITPRVFELNLITPAQLEAGAGFLDYVARLRPGISVTAAAAEMDALAAQYRREHPRSADIDPAMRIRVANLRDEVVANARTAVLLLFAAVALVLLIACGNVASLLLSRAIGRRRELAVRTALGATRAGLIRQLVTESVILALIGGALGVLLSARGTRVLTAMSEGTLPRAEEIHVDGFVLAFTAAISLLAGVVFGLAPALQISRTDLNSALRSEGRGATAGRHRNRLRSALVVGQVALCTVLLIGGGLLLRNFMQLRGASPGFDTHNLLTLNVALPPARYPGGSKKVAFFRDLVSRVQALPGTRSVAMSSALPVNPNRFSPALPDGQPQVPLAERPIFNIQTFTPGFVATMRVPLLRGREFTEHDGEYDPPVIMVNETAARRYWPKENAIGKHILLGRALRPAEIVGVLGDVRNLNLAADPQPEIYVPFAQLPWAQMNLLVRTDGDPHRLVSAVRTAVLAADRDQPVTAVKTMDEVFETAAAQPRFTTFLLGLLAATAMLLAVVGIYGVISCVVGERAQEMGVRIALGAKSGEILRLVLWQALLLAGSGIAIGIVAGLAVTRWMTGLLYHVSVTDPLTFAIVALSFIGVALVAGYVPARRAIRVDPVVTLRG
jgi:putative ABC transport system permease protein